MVRIYPDRQIQLDEGMGRSAYLCASDECLRVAQKKNRLGRSLKAAVPPIIYQALWQRLTETSVSRPAPPEIELLEPTQPSQSS